MQVGSEVARRARGLGLTVIAYDPYASEEKARAQVTGRQVVTAAASSELKIWQWLCSAVPWPQPHATSCIVPSTGAVHCVQGVTLMSLDDCLAKAEFFSLHMPLTPQTKVLGAMHDRSPRMYSNAIVVVFASCDIQLYCASEHLIAGADYCVLEVAEPLR